MSTPIWDSVVGDLSFDPELVPLTSSRHERVVRHTIWLQKTTRRVASAPLKRPRVRKAKAS